MKILRIFFACGILILVASCVSSMSQAQRAATSPQTAQRSRLHIAGASDDYDNAFMNEIESNWLSLLNRPSVALSHHPDKVILKFNLHSDGQISDMKAATNNAGDLQADICEEAVMKGVPYPPWTDAMLKTHKTNSCSFVFTFIYQ